MTSRLAVAGLVGLGLLGACAVDNGAPTSASRPGEDVFQMLGSWSYQASFDMRRHFTVADTLGCVVENARLELSEPMTPTTYTYGSSRTASYPWNLTARFATGTLTCQSAATPAFAVALSGATVEVSRAIVCAGIGFQVPTTIGSITVRGGTCGWADLNEILSATRMGGMVRATTGMRFREHPDGPPGRFDAQKG